MIDLSTKMLPPPTVKSSVVVTPVNLPDAGVVSPIVVPSIAPPLMSTVVNVDVPVAVIASMYP